MISLESSLTNQEFEYMELKEQLEQHEFTIGGNWDYDRGSFDRNIDTGRSSVWLRIPFEVVRGRFDADVPQPGTRVKVGTPYVLNHVVHRGAESEADFQTVAGFVNQFQSPADPDGELSHADVMEARQALQDIERGLK